MILPPAGRCSVDLSIDFLGLKLKSPLVPSACQPLTGSISNLRFMEDAGAGAVVLHSLFEEQLVQDRREIEKHLQAHTDSFSEASSFFPEQEEFLTGPEEYLNHIRKAKEAVQIPVIASLNGSTPGGWTDFAKQIELAGADALELNIYKIPTDTEITSEAIEKDYLSIVKSVRAAIKIPLTVKLSPYLTSMANMTKRLADAGATGFTLFNRFYQPDIDLEGLEVRPDILLSSPLTLRLPLRWIAILYGKVEADFAATSGIHKAEDCLKVIMAGASVTMLCSSLLRFGIGHIRLIDKKMREWMEEHEYASLEMMRGSMSQARCENPEAFERAQYLKALHRLRPFVEP